MREGLLDEGDTGDDTGDTGEAGSSRVCAPFTRIYRSHMYTHHSHVYIVHPTPKGLRAATTFSLDAVSLDAVSSLSLSPPMSLTAHYDARVVCPPPPVYNGYPSQASVFTSVKRVYLNQLSALNQVESECIAK